MIVAKETYDVSFKLAASIAFNTLCMAISGEMVWSSAFVASLQSSIFFTITETSTHSGTSKTTSSRTSTTKPTATDSVDLMLDVS